MHLHYQQHVKSPQAEWLVFFHGMGGDCSIFYKQIPFFQERFNLLLIDLPGHGHSASLEGQEPVEFSAREVIALLERLRLPPAHFMGVSLGTIIMQHIALLRPDLIKSMVLVGAVRRCKPWGERLVKLSQTFPLRQLLPTRLAYIVFAHVLLPRRNHRKSRSLFIRVARGFRPSDYRAWVSIFHGPERTYVQLERRRNTLPKLYIYGSQDHMFLPTARDFVEKEERAELIILPACGHICHIENASRFNELALAFLLRLAARPRLAGSVQARTGSDSTAMERT